MELINHIPLLFLILDREYLLTNELFLANYIEFDVIVLLDILCRPGPVDLEFPELESHFTPQAHANLVPLLV